eukprot:UN33415
MKTNDIAKFKCPVGHKQYEVKCLGNNKLKIQGYNTCADIKKASFSSCPTTSLWMKDIIKKS